MIDAAYIIGSLRSRERELLSEAQYTRLTDAPDMQAATVALTDTIYGQWMNENANWEQVKQAVGDRLKMEIGWLAKLRETNNSLRRFIETRQKVLTETAHAFSKQESMSAEEKMELLAETEEKALAALSQAAKTPLSKAYLALLKERGAADKKLREQIAAGETVDVEQFEENWDAKTVELIKPFAWEPVSDDAILAYWLKLELEAKKIRSIMAQMLTK